MSAGGEVDEVVVGVLVGVLVGVVGVDDCNDFDDGIDWCVYR